MEEFTLMPLPYDRSALRPVISARTLEFHHGKHHKAYVDRLNKLVAGTPYEHLPLEAIVRKAAGDAAAKKIFNNAGQIWNHDFFWLSMKPGGGGQPGGALMARIMHDFTSFELFGDLFVRTAVEHFGSGWAWLSAAADGGLKVSATPDAQSPLLDNLRPLLCCDLWEHAYYLDYQNDREGFVHDFLGRLANWTRASEIFDKAAPAVTAGKVSRAG